MGVARIDACGGEYQASCRTCQHCSDDSDGPQYGPPNLICTEKPHMTNLKGFPFESELKCYEPHFAFLVNWDEEAKKLNNPAHAPLRGEM